MNTNKFYQEGQLAQENGGSLLDNPYDEETQQDEYDSWVNGFKSSSMPEKKQLLSDMCE